MKGGAKEAEFPHRRNQLTGKPALAIAVFNDGNEIIFYKLSCRVAHHALVFGEERVEFKEINTTELKCHRIANNRTWPDARRKRTLDSIKGRIRRSMTLCRVCPDFLPATATHSGHYHWFRWRNSVMCAT